MYTNKQLTISNSVLVIFHNFQTIYLVGKKTKLIITKIHVELLKGYQD